ncbi:MAG: tetratricopeptide repeat protein [Rhodomicrobium sp.]
MLIWDGVDLAASHFNRANAYRELRDDDRAIADFNQAIRLVPEDALAYSNRGFANRKKGDYDRAVADYNRAMKLAPKNASPYYRRAFLYSERGDDERAVADFDQANRLVLENACYNGGLISEEAGRRKDAIADYRCALAKDPNDKDAKEALQRLGVEP